MVLSYFTVSGCVLGFCPGGKTALIITDRLNIYTFDALKFLQQDNDDFSGHYDISFQYRSYSIIHFCNVWGEMLFSQLLLKIY